jgi:hypothetical protein
MRLASRLAMSAEANNSPSDDGVAIAPYSGEGLGVNGFSGLASFPELGVITGD